MYSAKKILLTFYFLFFCFIKVFSQDTVIDSLLNEIKNTDNDTDKVKMLIYISATSLYNNPDKAIEYNNILFKLADSLCFQKHKATSLDISGVYYQNKGEYDKAESFYQKSLNIRKKINEPFLIAVSYTNFGVLNRRKGSYLEAEKYFLKVLAINKKENDTVSLAIAYNNLGLLMDDIGKYHKSIEYHLKSLDFREKLGKKQDIASSFNNIGEMFIAIKKYDKALNYLLKSLKIKEELGNKRLLGSTYLGIGEVKMLQGKYDEALDFYNKSLKISELLDDKERIGVVLSKMSYIAQKKGYRKNAVLYNLKSIEILKEIGSKGQLCASYVNLANTFYELNDFQKAYQYAIKAKEIASSNNILPSLKNILDLLYNIKTSQGDYKNANVYLEQYIEVKDSLFNENSNKQIFELQTKYETEQKEQTIVQLSKEKEINYLKNQRSRYIMFILGFILFGLILFGTLVFRHNKMKAKHESIELEQKLLRTQMNPHFIFNSISSIQDFILNNNPLEASSYLSDFAKLMRAILTNSSDNFISLSKEIETVEHYLKLQHLRLADKFDYTINVSDAFDREECMVPPMLLQPFIENSIKHGIMKKTDGPGLIKVRYYQENGHLILETEDNGIGRERSKKYNNTNHKSKAVDITNQRIKLLLKEYKQNIKFEIIDLKDNNNKPAGTLIRFILPIV